MRSVAAALACLGLAGALRAQSAVVTGTVTDSVGAPLEHVQVLVLGTHQRGVTDAAGRYRVAGIPAGRRVMRVSRLGFLPTVDTLTVAPGDSLTVDVILPLGAIWQPPVVVTAAKRSQLLEQAVTSVALVTDTELARRAVTTVDEAVDKAPGVQFVNGQVNIRGSSGYVQGLGSRVLMLVDGVPANEGDRGGSDWDLVPLEDIARAEIVKGAGSSLYGSAALGGVVNVITREIPTGVHARIRTLGGVYANPPFDIWKFRAYRGAEEGLDVTGSYGTERVRGSVTGGGWHSDGYREQDRRNHWQTAGKGEWLAAPTTRVTASGAWASDQYETPLIWCTTGTCNDRGQAFQPFMIDNAGRGAFTRSGKGYVAATVERTVSPSITWQARGSWLRTHFIDYQAGHNDAGVANRLGAELRGSVTPPIGPAVTVGVEGARSDVTSNIFGDHTETAFAAYGQTEPRLGAARLTLGARTDIIGVDGGSGSAVVSPRIGAVLPTTRWGIWRASLGRGFRAPSLAERFVATVVQGLHVIANPALNPETAWSFEVGNAASLGPVHCDAALFWTEAYDLIEPTVKLDSAQIQFKNVARARLAGLDLALTAAPPVAGLTMTLSYTLLYAHELAHDTVPERPLAFRPKHLLTLAADWQHGALGIGGDFRYVSRFERVELYETDPRVAERVVNLRASGAWGSWTLRGQLTNALNYVYNQVPRTLAPVRTAAATLTWTY